MAIQLKNIDNTLKKHPYFRLLTDEQRIQIYNSSYQHFFLENETKLLTYWDVDIGNVNHIYSDGSKKYIDEQYDPYVDYLHRLLNRIERSVPLPLQPVPENILSTYKVLEESHIKYLNEFSFEQKKLIYHTAINKIKKLRENYYQVESKISAVTLFYITEVVASLEKSFIIQSPQKIEFEIIASIVPNYLIKTPLREEVSIEAKLSKGYHIINVKQYEFTIEANTTTGTNFPERTIASITAGLRTGFNLH